MHSTGIVYIILDKHIAEPIWVASTEFARKFEWRVEKTS